MRFLLPEGKYSVFGNIKKLRNIAPKVNAPTTVSLNLLSDKILSTVPEMYPAMFLAKVSRPHKLKKVFPSCFFAICKIFDEKVGITVIAMIRLKTTDTLIAIAMSLKSCPACSCTNITGRNTAAVVSVLASTAPQTSVAPS